MYTRGFLLLWGFLVIFCIVIKYLKKFLLWKISSNHTKENSVRNTFPAPVQSAHATSAIINISPFWYHLSTTFFAVVVPGTFKAP